MTVLVEVGLAGDRFALGRHLGGPAEVELERLIPLGDALPYVWATGEPSTLDELTAHLEASDATTSVTVLDRLGVDGDDRRRQLYRIGWVLAELDVVPRVVRADGAILDGTGVDGRWRLRFRFPDHERVADFHRYLADSGLTGFSVRRIRSTDAEDPGEWVALTPEQREALALAARRGYFDTPRAVTLSELGTELDISEQAVSQRLRRAIRTLVFSALDLPDGSASPK